ncbi:MAG: hypothetical protein H6686_00360 [Fibrobacteria bacterium]|nr:hypothetical protein [Fibrobacteria bacterium]
MNRRLVLALVATSMALAACNKEEEAAPPPPPPPKPKEFATPTDGLLQPERAARWRQADSLVRLIDSTFSESIKASPDRAGELTQQQNTARDLAVRKAGLLGWKEYRWILEEAPRNPANAAAFEAAGLSMATTGK